MTNPLPSKERSLIERLFDAQIASCSCLTKTPDIQHHKSECHYRLFTEAAAALRAVDTELDAMLGRIAFKYIDRMNDRTDDDDANRIVDAFLAEAIPALDAHWDARRAAAETLAPARPFAWIKQSFKDPEDYSVEWPGGSTGNFSKSTATMLAAHMNEAYANRARAEPPADAMLPEDKFAQAAARYEKSLTQLHLTVEMLERENSGLIRENSRLRREVILARPASKAPAFHHDLCDAEDIQDCHGYEWVEGGERGKCPCDCHTGKTPIAPRP